MCWPALTPGRLALVMLSTSSPAAGPAACGGEEPSTRAALLPGSPSPSASTERRPGAQAAFDSRHGRGSERGVAVKAAWQTEDCQEQVRCTCHAEHWHPVQALVFKEVQAHSTSEEGAQLMHTASCANL